MWNKPGATTERKSQSKHLLLKYPKHSQTLCIVWTDSWSPHTDHKLNELMVMQTSGCLSTPGCNVSKRNDTWWQRRWMVPFKTVLWFKPFCKQRNDISGCRSLNSWYSIMTDPGGKNLVGNLDTSWPKLVSTYLSVAEVNLVCVCLGSGWCICCN